MKTRMSVAAVLVGAGIVTWMLVGDGGRDDGDSVKRGRARASERRSTTTPKFDATQDSAADDGSQHDAVEHPPESGVLLARREPLPGEDPRTPGWSNLSADERRKILEADLGAALKSLRAGDDVERATANARSTLSVLRAELMQTASGRARYEELEAEVERLTGDAVGEVER